MKKIGMSTTVLATLTMMVTVASATPVAQSTAGDWQAHPTKKIMPHGSSPTYQSGITPAQMRQAYGLDKLTNDGTGQTIAIVDAYGSPTIQNDLAVFDAQFGLPAANLTIATPQGTPTVDTGWAGETSLDVEWVHALAPKANILLVEAKSASTADLVGAIDYATQNGATVVSNSWGGGEFRGETTYDSHFQHNGVVYVASSGDSGAGASWPCASPYVLGVGGTTLTTDTSGNWASETAWSGSGGAKSRYESMPSYQSNWSGVVGTKRGIPDVAMDADPASGVAVYDSTADNGYVDWYVVGGTSLAAPLWASVIGLTNQGRTSNLTSLDAITQLYKLAGKTGSTGYVTNFHDVTSGSNGNSALAGYDLVTGLGSPVANNLIPNLTVAP